MNTNETPLRLLNKLAFDENPDVRYEIAEDANTPFDLLRMMTEDENPYVAERAKRTLNRLGRWQVIAA
jgi:hypothetical protein